MNYGVKAGKVRRRDIAQIFAQRRDLGEIRDKSAWGEIFYIETDDVVIMTP